MIKVLNLYAGIGGNRKLWENVEVTAVENVPEIADIYQDYFPNDTMVMGDAHQFLLDHFDEFDFIWSSPPCPTHSRLRYGIGVLAKHQCKPVYPDMKLYEEILFLKHHFKGQWVVENVTPYYEPLIRAQKVGRHCFWANFIIGNKRINEKVIRISLAERQENKGFDLSNYKLPNKVQVVNNCVKPEIGLHVFQAAFKNKQKTLKEMNGTANVAGRGRD